MSAPVLLLLVALALLAGCALIVWLSPRPGDELVRVLSVCDGDTLRVRVPGGQVVAVRLLGIDAPESCHPHRPVQPGGREAAAFVRELLTARRVRLVRDPGGDDRDRYGRWLRFVELADGRDVGVLLVRAGWARPMVFGGRPCSRAQEIAAAAAEARRAGRGVWAGGNGALAVADVGRRSWRMR